MAATVGARLEEVQRPRSLFGPDYLRLAAVAAVAIVVHGWLISHTALTARDSLGFARQALCLENPSAAPPNPDGRPKNAVDHIRAGEQPPGYPLVVWATDAVVRHVSNRSVPDRILLSAQIASAIAAILLVIPTYLIGRMLFSRNVGFAGALLFQVLPVPAQITSDGLTEGVYLLVAAVAIMLGVRAVRRPRISSFLLCGLTTGASYLVRPEGLMIAAASGAVVIWLGLTRRWPRDMALARLTALLVGVFLVSSPYVVLIGKFSNKPTVPYLDPTKGAPGPIYRGGPESTLRGTGQALFAAWWNHELDAGRSREVWAFGAFFKETSKSANYIIWPLAIFAIITLRRKFASEPGLWVLVLLCILDSALLIYLPTRTGYISERHTLLLTLIACQFAAAGLPLFAAGLGQLLPRVERLGVRITAAGILVALVASSLPFALKPMHKHREGHKHAGLWLATHITDNDALIDPFCWAEWYSGRTRYRTSWNPDPYACRYVIWENKTDSPHSRLPVFEGAKLLKEDPQARLVYHWPENVPAEKAAIHVYRLPPSPKPTTQAQGTSSHVEK